MEFCHHFRCSLAEKQATGLHSTVVSIERVNSNMMFKAKKSFKGSTQMFLKTLIQTCLRTLKKLYQKTQTTFLAPTYGRNWIIPWHYFVIEVEQQSRLKFWDQIFIVWSLTFRSSFSKSKWTGLKNPVHRTWFFQLDFLKFKYRSTGGTPIILSLLVSNLYKLETPWFYYCQCSDWYITTKPNYLD